jgi:hypothetical protein
MGKYSLFMVAALLPDRIGFSIIHAQTLIIQYNFRFDTRGVTARRMLDVRSYLMERV